MVVDDLSVSLLGGVQASRAGDPVAVVGTKLQALLAMLALAAPQPVSVDRLMDGIWGDDPPGNPVNALQAQVSQLRRLLGSEAIVRAGVGYALTVDPDAIDAQRVERLVADGRRAVAESDFTAACECFGAAVQLVRGQPLEELADHHFAQEAATRLHQLVLAAHEGDIDAKLASGRHAEVVEPLQSLVEEHPLRERFHAQLITALYRSGRQADALTAYRTVRDVLSEEMGLDPGPELQALAIAVLSQDPSLAAPVALSTTRHLSPLPVPLTSFVGRSDELAQLDDAVRRSRLVTLVGPGGVGKTRLVLEFARGRAAGDEIWFVELAPVTDPLAVPETVAAALGAHDDSPTEDPTAARPANMRSIDRLGSRTVSVVLDNCEHVAEAAAQVAQTLLAGCAQLTVIATSREPLRIAGEVQIPVTPLTDEEASLLFRARAQAVQPAFGRDDDDEELRTLCRRLDRLPLAIELAAARTKSFAIPEIAARLEDRFQLLRSTGRGGDARHLGLGAAIDWSYDMLFEDERRAFCRLALFAGGVTVDAATTVCGPDAIDTIERLVDRSLLVADTAGTESRFRMLESLRAYGLARLAESGELDDAIGGYLAWCLDLAADAERGVRGSEQLRWLDRLDAEHDNLRAAFSHAESVDPGVGLRLIGSLVLPWWLRGRRQEARHWAETWLNAAPEADPRDVAKALAWCGFIAESSGWTGTPGGMEQELELAERRQRRALELCAEVADAALAADVTMLLAVTLTRRAVAGIAIQPQELADVASAALRSYQEQDDFYGAGLVRMILAIVSLASGDLAAAAVQTEAAREAAQRSGDRFTSSRVEWMLGMLDDVGGDQPSAYRHMERSLRLAAELGMEQAVTAQAGLLIPLAERSGQPDVAAQWLAFVESRAPGSARDDMLTMASARNGEGLRARSAGDFARAVAAHQAALTWYDEASVSGGAAYTESCLGFLATEMGDESAAAAHHGAALAAAVIANLPATLALALEGAASLLVAAEPARAAALLGAAAALWEQSSTAATASHRGDVDRVDRALRDVLGPAEFDAAFARGGAFERAEAVATARLAHGDLAPQQ